VKTTEINRVLVRMPNWVGDAVMALPALRTLRRVLPNRHVAVLARPRVAGLFEEECLADQIILTRGSSPADFIRDSRNLRRECFDLAVLFQNAFGAALMARAAGIRNVAGYPSDRRRLLLSAVVPLDPALKTSHQVFYYLGIAQWLHRTLFGEGPAAKSDAVPTLSASASLRNRAGELLARHGMVQTNSSSKAEGQAPPAFSRIVALSPGATNSRAKRWFPDRFAAVADRLAEADGFEAIIVGTERDMEAASQVASRMKSKAVVLAGLTTISELKGLLACSSLVISNDTGTAHVSAALGIPTVVVFGPTEHFSTHPFSELSAVVRHNVECSPCMLRDCPIDCDDVYDAAKRLLKTAGSRRNPSMTDAK
jgi:heptosyltransferase-2